MPDFIIITKWSYCQYKLVNICLLPFIFMYMFVPFYIFVNIVFVLMGRMAYWILN